MAYIVLADQRHPKELEAAAAHLRKDGHEVQVVTEGGEAMNLFQRKAPDILALSFFLRYQDGFEVLERLTHLYPHNPTSIVWITILDNGVPQCPIVDWADRRISGYLLSPYRFGDVVLAVEQLLYRKIMFAME